MPNVGQNQRQNSIWQQMLMRNQNRMGIFVGKNRR